MSPTARYFHRIKNFSRNAKLFIIANSLQGVGFGISQVILNLYLLELGYNEGFLGTLISTSFFVAMLFTLPGGRIGDFFGRRKALLWGTILGGLGILGQATLPLPWLIILAAAITQIGRTMFMVVGAPVIAESSSDEDRAHLFGISGAALSFSAIAGSTLGGYLPTLYGHLLSLPVESVLTFRLTLLSQLLFLGIGLLPLLMLGETGSSDGRRNGGSLLNFRFSEPQLVLHLALPQLLIGIGAGMIMPFVNVFLKQHFNATPAQIGIIFAWDSVATGLAALLSPVFVARSGKLKTLTAVQLLSIPFLLGVAFAPGLWFAAAALWLRSGFMRMSNPVRSNFVMEIVNPRERATVYSMQDVGFRLGWSGGSLLAGWLMAHSLYTLPYILTSICYTAGALLFWYLMRNRAEKPPATEAARVTAPASHT